jgi:hypothetical protein
LKFAISREYGIVKNLKHAFGASGGTIMQIAFRASSNQLMANQPNARAAPRAPMQSALFHPQT